MTASLDYEFQFTEQGYRRIVGLDEAGYGAWAGPVYAGAVCLSTPSAALAETLKGVRDSKLMTPRQRERLALVIEEHAYTYGVGFATPDEINTQGIRPATRLALERALNKAIAQRPGFAPDVLLFDGLGVPSPIAECEFLNIKRGDQLSLSIAAASVLAKVARDEYMKTLDPKYAVYQFAVHKGYGTAKHRAALEQHGVSDLHRRTYKPILRLLDGE